MKRALAASLASWLLAGNAVANDLVQVYDDALRNDPQIRQADATRLATREARPQAWSALLPQLTGGLSRVQDKQDGTQGTLNYDPATNSYIPLPEPYGLDSSASAWSLNLRQSVFSWSNWMTVKQADAQVAQAEVVYQSAQQNLILRTATAYFAVLAAQDTLEANQAALRAITNQLDQAESRYAVGLIAVTDVQEARSAHDTAAATVIAAKRSLATAGDQLAEITGRSYDSLAKPGDDMPLSSPEPAEEQKWVDASLDQNAALLSDRLGADIARQNVRIAFGGHLPTIDLVASKSRTVTNADESVLGSNPFTLDSVQNDRQYTLQFSVPLFSGGYTQSRVRQAQYQWIAAKDQVELTSRATERQARDAYLGVISGIARVKALHQAVASNETALQATEASYEAGTRTALDVLNSRRLLVQAQTEYASSRYDYIVSVVELRLAAGNLTRKDVQEINSWLVSSAPTTPAHPLEPPSQAVTPETSAPPPQ